MKRSASSDDRRSLSHYTFWETLHLFFCYSGPDVKRGEADTVWRIDDAQSSFHSRPFKIRYSRQDVLLQEMVSFHLKVGKQVITVLTDPWQH